MNSFVPGVVFSLCENEASSIASHSTFVSAYSLVLNFSKLPSHAKGRLLDALTSNLSVLRGSAEGVIRSAPSEDRDIGLKLHCTSLKIYSYLLKVVFDLCEEEALVQGGSGGAAGKSKGKKHASDVFSWEKWR